MRAINRDRTAAGIMLAYTVLSIVSFIFFFVRGDTLAYTDAKSHLMISRRVVDSITPGVAQMGGVWLDLPHWLTVPLVWHDFLFYSGIAGSIVSMGSYVALGVYLYRTAIELTGSKVAGVIAAAIFGLNPNVLYMQSTAMTELPLFLFSTMAVYYLLRYDKTPHLWTLILCALSVLAATRTRYEAWSMLGTLSPVLLIVLYKHYGLRGWRKIEDRLVLFGFITGLGVITWLGWNLVIFGDHLRFTRGEYASPSNWVSEADVAVGNWEIALRTYWIATILNVGLLTVGIGILGLLHLSVRTRLGIKTLAVTPMVVIFPFFVVMLYTGQRPLHVWEITGDWYNTRFALQMILPLSLGAAYLAAKHKIAILAVLVAIAATFGQQWPDQIITLVDPQAALESAGAKDQLLAVDWLRENYDRGVVLMESYANELALFESRLPLDRVIYEGTYRIWELALANPAEYAQWVYMRTETVGNLDKVFVSYTENPERFADFVLAYQNPHVSIYKLRGT